MVRRRYGTGCFLALCSAAGSAWLDRTGALSGACALERALSARPGKRGLSADVGPGWPVIDGRRQHDDLRKLGHLSSPATMVDADPTRFASPCADSSTTGHPA